MDNERLLPPGESTPESEVPKAFGASTPRTPSPQAQSWGALISILIIVLMVIIGAFYAWGARIAQNRVFTASTTAQ